MSQVVDLLGRMRNAVMLGIGRAVEPNHVWSSLDATLARAYAISNSALNASDVIEVRFADDGGERP